MRWQQQSHAQRSHPHLWVDDFKGVAAAAQPAAEGLLPQALQTRERAGMSRSFATAANQKGGKACLYALSPRPTMPVTALMLRSISRHLSPAHRSHSPGR